MRAAEVIILLIVLGVGGLALVVVGIGAIVGRWQTRELRKTHRERLLRARQEREYVKLTRELDELEKQ